MSDNQDLIYVYGEKVRKPTPIEPLTKEELKLQSIPEDRRNEYRELMNMCATDCKYCGASWKEHDYGGSTRHSIPFVCDIDAANRVCQGCCSKYAKHFKVLGIFSNRVHKPSHTLEAYVQSWGKGRYDKLLNSFSWYKRYSRY